MADNSWTHIKNLIDDNAIDSIVEMCIQMQKYEFQVIKNKLINELRITNSKVHRNTIAIVLSDLKCDEAVETLIDLINDPQNMNYRGTFIYALKELKCESVLKNLIHVLFDGNLEVRYNMYDLLSEKVKYMSEAYKLECLNLIRAEKQKIEEELELLEDVEQSIFRNGQ